MDSTRINDELRRLERMTQELRVEVARLPVREAKTRSFAVTVYEFWLCGDEAYVLYADNPEIAQHEEGEIAVIDRDGFIECWELQGPASHCKTGECVAILGWGADCESCSQCFILNPCTSGSIVVVRGIDWFEYVGKTVLIDAAGTGAACYFVTEAETCDGVDDTLTPDDIEAVYAECSDCGCYQLTHCDTAATQLVSDDLAGLFGRLPAAVVGMILELDDGCWEVTAFQNPCSGAASNRGISGSTPTYETCEECGCYLISPCSGNEGDPWKVKPGPSDTIDLRDFVNDDGTSNGKAFMRADFTCWTVSVPEDGCLDAVSGVGTVLETFDDCDCCGVTCWERCDSPGTYIRTYNDLCEYKRSGVALKRAEDGFCYEYEDSIGACGTPAIVAFTVEEVYEHSTDACAQCLDPKFRLTPSCDPCEEGSGDCGSSSGSGGGGTGGCKGDGDGGSSPTPGDTGAPSEIITQQADLRDAVGQYVKFDGRCYLVETADPSDTVTHETLCWVGPYPTCEECQLAPSMMTVGGPVYWEGNTLKQDIKVMLLAGTICSEHTCSILTKGPCPEETP